MTARPLMSQPRPVAADPLGRWAAFAEQPHTLVVARLPEQAAGSSQRWQATVPEGIASLSASRDGRWLAVGHQTGDRLTLWAPVDEELSAWLEVSSAMLPFAAGEVQLDFSPTEDSLAVARGDQLRVLRLDLDELNRMRAVAAEAAAGAKARKRVFISSPSEYSIYAGLLETALNQDLKVERPMKGTTNLIPTSPISAPIDRVDALVTLIGTAGRRQAEAEIRQAKRHGIQIIAILVSPDIRKAGELRDLAVANVDAEGRVLALSGQQGAAVTRVINSTAINILRSMEVDTAPLLHELQNTYDDATSRFFNPPSEVQRLGRRLHEGTFRELTAQIGLDELLLGLYENQAPALVATHINSRARLHELSMSNLMPLGYYALRRETANRGWDRGTPVSAEAVERPMVVVSYVRSYATLARALVSALEATGRIDVRYDGHLSSEQPFPSTVLQWVDQSDALVALVGPASAQANYSKAELERAQKLRKPVVAVVVEAGELPSALASYQAINVDSDGTPTLLARLQGRRLESALRRVALQVVEAVTKMASGALQRSAPANRSGTGTGSATDAQMSSAQEVQARFERDVVHAVPGEDIVVLRVAQGPQLILHPENARDLLRAQERSSRELNWVKGGADDAPMAGSAGPTDAELGAADDPADGTVSTLTSGGTPPVRASGLLGGVQLSSFEVVGGLAKDPSDQIVPSRLVERIDGQVDAGVYALSSDLLVPLKGRPQHVFVPPPPTRDATQPLLVLIHGSFVETSMTFGRLWTDHPDLVATIFQAYAGRVYAFEHHTLGASVVSNALMLARVLPDGAHLHLAAHGRGGLVAEVLARAASAEFDSTDFEHFATPAHGAQRIALRELGQIVRRRRLQVDRVVRVACPARGSLLASRRLDAYLSILKWSLELSGVSVRPELIDFIGEVARRRTSPEDLPGLEGLLSDSPLIRWLNAAENPIPGALRVLAGDTIGDSVASWVKTLVSDAFYWTDNDLVVQTRSMYGGGPRVSGSTFWLDSGSKVSHYAYFANAASAHAFTRALLHDQPEGFRQIGPLSHAGQDAGGVR